MEKLKIESFANFITYPMKRLMVSISIILFIILKYIILKLIKVIYLNKKINSQIANLNFILGTVMVH